MSSDTLQNLSAAFDPKNHQHLGFDDATIRAELQTHSGELTPNARAVLAHNLRELALLIGAMGDRRSRNTLVRQHIERQLLEGSHAPESAVDALKWVAAWLESAQDSAPDEKRAAGAGTARANQSGSPRRLQPGESRVIAVALGEQRFGNPPGNLQLRVVPGQTLLIAAVVIVVDDVSQRRILQRDEAVRHAGRNQQPYFAALPHLHQRHRAPSRRRLPQVHQHRANAAARNHPVIRLMTVPVQRASAARAGPCAGCRSG